MVTIISNALLFDQYNAVHVWLPEILRYVTVVLINLPTGMAVYAPKLDLRTTVVALCTTNLHLKLQRNEVTIDDKGMNILA
jgi:hypothetical protein